MLQMGVQFRACIRHGHGILECFYAHPLFGVVQFQLPRAEDNNADAYSRRPRTLLIRMVQQLSIAYSPAGDKATDG